MDPKEFNSAQENQQPFLDHQRNHVHTCSGPNPQQKPGKVPTPTHMGPSSTCISYTAVQAFQPSSTPPPPKPPTGSSPHHPPLSLVTILVPPPTVHLGGGTYFS